MREISRLAGRQQCMSISPTWSTDCPSQEHCGLQRLALQCSAACALQHQSQPAGSDGMPCSFPVLPAAPPLCVLIWLCCAFTTSCFLQILCSRLKILAMPPGRALRAPFAQAAPDPHQQADLAPVIMRGVWQRDASQKTLRGRVR